MARNPVSPADDDPIVCFARQLAAAYIAWQLGVSVAYAERRYTNQSKRINDYWVKLAERVANDVQSSLARQVLAKEEMPSSPFIM